MDASWAGHSALSAADTMTRAPCWVNLPSSWTRCTIASDVWPPFLTASQVRMAQLVASIPRPSRSLGLRVCSRQMLPHASILALELAQGRARIDKEGS